MYIAQKYGVVIILKRVTDDEEILSSALLESDFVFSRGRRLCWPCSSRLVSRRDYNNPTVDPYKKKEKRKLKKEKKSEKERKFIIRKSRKKRGLKKKKRMWEDREEKSKDEKRKIFLLLERLHDVPTWNNPHTPSFVQWRTCPSEKNSLARFLEKDFYIERLIGRQGRRSPTTQIIHTPAVFHTLRKNRAPSESSGIYDFSRWTDGICHTVVEACISGAKSRWTGCCWKYQFSKHLRTTSWTYSPNLLNHKKEIRISSIVFFGPVTNIYIYIVKVISQEAGVSPL